MKPQSCWEFWDCPKETRDKCPAYRRNAGKNCFNLAMDFCPKVTNEFKHCWECPWYKTVKDIILVVEDEAIIASELQMQLESMGFKVPYIESTGEGAVKRALEVKPALILMDIVLRGDMDGIEAAKQIRLKSDIPIIYVTAYSTEDIFEKAKATEPYAYLIKPTDSRELKSNIEIALYKHRMENTFIKASKKWEAIFDSIGQPAMVLDSDHYIVEANKATLKATRMTKEQLVGKKCYEIFHKSTEPPENCPMSKVLQSNQPSTEPVELEAFGRQYMVSCTPILDETGHLENVIHIATDITELKKLGS